MHNEVFGCRALRDPLGAYNAADPRSWIYGVGPTEEKGMEKRAGMGETMVTVVRSSRGAQGMEASMGWGIWHILCIK